MWLRAHGPINWPDVKSLVANESRYNELINDPCGRVKLFMRAAREEEQIPVGHWSIKFRFKHDTRSSYEDLRARHGAASERELSSTIHYSVCNGDLNVTINAWLREQLLDLPMREGDTEAFEHWFLGQLGGRDYNRT